MAASSCSSLPGSLDSCLSETSQQLSSWTPRDVWIYSLIATLMVSLCGVIPIVFIPLDGAKSLNTPGGAAKLRCFLSFAVGSLLGDVFLHLLPEAWKKCSENGSHTSNGLLVVFGVLSFSFIEKLFQAEKDVDDSAASVSSDDGFEEIDADLSISNPKEKVAPRSKVTGYLNLLANCIDNFTHGLAIGGSFLASYRVGVLTTFAILIHEIPHEIADFAILIRSGFDRLGAAKAQFLTAAGGLLGAAAALWTESADDVEQRTSWILPFAAGGFLNIALVNLLPELLQERSILESCKQMLFLSAGVGVMAFVNHVFEG